MWLEWTVQAKRTGGTCLLLLATYFKTSFLKTSGKLSVAETWFATSLHACALHKGFVIFVVAQVVSVAAFTEDRSLTLHKM